MEKVFEKKVYDHFLKANLSWSQTRAKFSQLLVLSKSVALPQLNLTKLKLEYLKSGFKCKKETYKEDEKKIYIT